MESLLSSIQLMRFLSFIFYFFAEYFQAFMCLANVRYNTNLICVNSTLIRYLECFYINILYLYYLFDKKFNDRYK